MLHCLTLQACIHWQQYMQVMGQPSMPKLDTAEGLLDCDSH